MYKTNFNGINLLDGSLSSAGSTAKKIDISQSTALTHSYKGGTIADSQTDAKKGDTISYTVSWEGSDGKSYSNTVKLKYESDDLKKLTSVGSGKEYTVADKKATGQQLADIVFEELTNDSRLTSDFNITKNGTGIDFTAKESGTKAGNITGTVMGHSGDANPTMAAGTISEAKDSVTKISTGTLKVMKTVINQTNKTLTEDNKQALRDAVFEINGKQFIIQQTGVGNALDADELKVLGPDVHVLNAAGTTVGTNDVKGMAAEISRITGLDFEQGVANPTGTGITEQI